jgi:very-short-patch-repair endonuclease
MSRQHARDLRKNMTDAERFVWQRIRYRQMGGHKFRRQVELGSYIVDFVCLARRLIVELDGGQHAEQHEYDAVRDAWLRSQGFDILRFWNHEAMRDWDAVEEVIMRSLGKSAPPPRPSPAKGEGDET